MKLFSILIIFLSFFFCSFGGYEKINEQSPDSLFVAKPTNGQGKEVSPYYLLNKDSITMVVFFQDSIAGVRCVLYKQCEIGAGMIPSVADTPELYKQYRSIIDSEQIVLFINGKYESVRKYDEDISLFSPQNIGYFEFKGDRYVYINLFKLSYIGHDGYLMVLVKLHGNKVIDTYVIGSQDQLGSENFGERKGDRSLDYYIESDYSNTDSTIAKAIDIYSLQNSKLLYSNPKMDTATGERHLIIHGPVNVKEEGN